MVIRRKIRSIPGSEKSTCDFGDIFARVAMWKNLAPDCVAGMGQYA